MSNLETTQSSGYTPALKNLKLPKLSQPAEPDVEVLQRDTYRRRTIKRGAMAFYVAGAASVLLVQNYGLFYGKADAVPAEQTVATVPASADPKAPAQ